MGARFFKDGRFFSRDTAFCGQDDSQEDQNGLCFDVFSSDQPTCSCRVGTCQSFCRGNSLGHEQSNDYYLIKSVIERGVIHGRNISEKGGVSFE